METDTILYSICQERHFPLASVIRPKTQSEVAYRRKAIQLMFSRGCRKVEVARALRVGKDTVTRAIAAV